MAREPQTTAPTSPRVRALEILWPAVLVAAASGTVHAIGLERLADADVVMIYLAVIMVAAVRFGRLASIVAAALSVAAFDFFFVAPRFTFSVADPRHLFTFVMMFAVGLLISSLALRLKQQQAALVVQRTEEVRASLLSAVSHDLRTPLAAIAGAATTLRDENAPLPVEERRALLDSIAEEAFHLERLVSSLLDMTRVESALVLSKQWVPVEELVGSALARTEARLTPRAVRTSIMPNVPLVHVDPTLFERVLVNLFENAAKHTPPSSTITMDVTATPRALTLTLSDNGPGLPAGIDVFEKFARGPSSLARGTGGVGLGLSICKAIIEAHGGTITATSDDGAIFRVTLPATETPPRGPEEDA